jgi:glycosyltransferase involved in cell wall biosynthesis
MPDRVAVIIPAFNEERGVGKVITDIPTGLVHEIVVVDNNSTDLTGEAARAAGATVLFQPKPGYGHACMTGIDYLASKPADSRPDIAVFIDADYSDHAEDMEQLVQPIMDQDVDMVIGSRALGTRTRGALSTHQVLGNRLATRMIRLLYGVTYTDLGPFRAIRFDKLLRLGMRDRNYGWTVEMQVKAAKQRLRFVEVPVRYRRRIGKSKVSGTLRGSIGAGYKILATIIRYA